jgi:hypothetical protein
MKQRKGRKRKQEKASAKSSGGKAKIRRKGEIVQEQQEERKVGPVHEKYHQSVEIHERKVLRQSFPENFLRNIDKWQRNITSNYVSQGK